MRKSSRRKKTKPAHYPHLEKLVYDPLKPNGMMCYPEILGFLFAIAASPAKLPIPEEYLNVIFGIEEGNNYPESVMDTIPQELYDELIACHDELEKQVKSLQLRLPPGYVRGGDYLSCFSEHHQFSLWSRGFSNGHIFLEDIWEEYLAIDTRLEEVVASIVAILSFFADRDTAEELHQAFAPSKTFEETAKIFYDQVPQVMRDYAAIGRFLRARE